MNFKIKIDPLELNTHTHTKFNKKLKIKYTWKATKLIELFARQHHVIYFVYFHIHKINIKIYTNNQRCFIDMINNNNYT